MKKRVFGRKLKRDVNERKALFKGLMSSLVLNEKIETTEAKGKAIKGEVDKLVTKARKENILARRLLSPKLSPEALEKMIRDIAPRFSKRQGGYTKTVRLGKRFGDDASMVLIEWTEKSQISNLKSQNLDENKSTKAENKPEPKNKKLTKLKKEIKKPAESKTRKRTVKK